jgi:hypothetical protein
MIKLESVTIENFRGIKNLLLDFRQKNFCICGPNGTGKSGIVDAIEFGLTGTITRLTGRGAGDLSVKGHAPHVDLRDDPSKAVVRLLVYSPALDKKFVIERRVSKPKQPRIEPNETDIQALTKRLAQHPELALSRREIVKYVIAEPGARSEEVQALLKLEDIGKLRKTLTTLTNNFNRDLAATQGSLERARTLLLSGLEVTEAKAEKILEVVNKRRSLLSASPLTTLEKGTSVKAGIEPGAKKGGSTVSKVTASSDIGALAQLARSQESPEFVQAAEKTREILGRLQSDPTLLRDLQHYSLLQRGLELIESNECPLCGSRWEMEELRLKIQTRLNQARMAGELRAELQTAIQPFRSLIRSLSGLVELCLSYTKVLLSGRELIALTTWIDFLRSLEDCLELNQLGQLQAWLHDDRRPLPPEVEEEIAAVSQAVAALPDLTERDAAWDFLVIAQERLENYVTAKTAAVNARHHFNTANKITAVYAGVSDAHLVQLYEEVQKDFSRYYALIHHEDESSFFAQLIPSLGKLSFAVDFYGRGTFPPGAYHSEGHQDSMGLCLYLALMKRTMGANFTLAILDDVLMSVDAGHRKDVVRLLKTEFPKTQFIFTTHDQVWLNHMMNEGLISKESSLQIRRWTVDDGPCVWGAKDIWAEIAKDLETNNVLGASSLLRNYLERITPALAERLRAQVEYRSDGAHDFGDLIGPVVGRWKDLLRYAKAAASSWNKREEIECLAEMERRFTALYDRTGIDNWMINRALHYNEWANLQRQDFAPLVGAYRDFLACFECPNCRTLLYVTPKKGKAEVLRCTCNIFNLVSNSQKRDKVQPPTTSKEPRTAAEQRDLF